VLRIGQGGPRRILLLFAIAAGPADGASFVYEGRLDDRGTPADGRYDIRLAAFPDATRGTTLAAPMEFAGVEVRDGRFRLEFDLPAAAADGTWLELGVRESGAVQDYATIAGRAKAVATPLVGACWSTTGDSGSNPALNFIGTIDAVAFEIRTQGRRSLRLEPSALLVGGQPATVGVVAGSPRNSVAPGVRGATIAGGGAEAFDDPEAGASDSNRVAAHYGTVGGGLANTAGDPKSTAPTAGIAATVAGGRSNAALGEASTVAGGAGNVARGGAATVAGGAGNVVDADYAAVAGGVQNLAMADGATVGGGEQNIAFGAYSMIAGGFANATSGYASAVGGGERVCAGGRWSWAGGRNARVRRANNDLASGVCLESPDAGDANGDEGSFVWADSQAAELVTTGPNQFLVRAGGGMALNGAPPSRDVEFTVIGSGANGGDYANLLLRQVEPDRGAILLSAGEAGAGSNNASFYLSQLIADGDPVHRLRTDGNGRLQVFVDNPVKPTAGGWSAPSDARLKHAIAPLDGALDRLLALRGVRFEYNADAPKGYYTPGPQVGFIAQEVERVFPDWVSTDADGWKLVGSRGFEALAVEAVRQLHDENAAIDDDHARRIAALEAGNAALHARLAALEARLAGAARQAGDAP